MTAPTILFLCLYMVLVVVQCKSITITREATNNYSSNISNRPSSDALDCNKITKTGDLMLEEAESVIRDYISSPSCEGSSLSNGNDNNNNNFHIHGWKWHTMSLVHEARRLNQLAVKLQEQKEEGQIADLLPLCTALQTVADYTIDFNMRGLHRIENDVFMPTLRQKIQTSSKEDMLIKSAITTLLNQLDKDRNDVNSFGSSVMKEVSVAADTLTPWYTRTQAVEKIATNAASIADTAQRMLRREEEFLIPIVSRIFSEQEQKSVNNQVIRKLGIFDSRLHLVGMHEALVHSSRKGNGQSNSDEMQTFRKVIPSLPQRLIPRWKRTMYEPRAGALDKLFEV